MLKKLIAGVLIVGLFTTSLLPGIANAKTQLNDDIVFVEIVNGEYIKIKDDKNLKINTNLEGKIKAVKKKDSHGIYAVEGKKEYLLKVADDKFQPVGELTLDPTNEEDLKKLRDSKVGQEVKDELIQYANYCKESNLTSGTVSVYSPTLLTDQSGDVSTLGSSSTYFYYQGTGGYTYKQESIFYTNWFTRTDTTYSDSYSELQNFLYKNISYGANYIVGLIPYIGTSYSLMEHFADLFWSAPVESFQGSELSTRVEETSRETRFCYIRQNLGSGLNDYLKARSCFTNLRWHETLTIQGVGTNSKILNYASYKGAWFDNLDSKAYDYRVGQSAYDERLISVTHSETGSVFSLAP